VGHGDIEGYDIRFVQLKLFKRFLSICSCGDKFKGEAFCRIANGGANEV
jgi:hypothetical protein